jgi:hypothetical protein
VRKERQRLFEEFVQAGENWAESSIVLNNKNTQRETQRGIYKLFSKEEPNLHWFVQYARRVFDLGRPNLYLST